MAGPTIVDLPEIDNGRPDDLLYAVRGVAAGRDRKVQVTNISKYDIIISTQAEFEYWFGTGNDEATGVTGTTQGGWVCVDVADDETVTVPTDISILIKSNPSDGVTAHFKYDATNYIVEAYELNTQIKLSTGVTIHGEGIDQTIIARNSTDNYPMFITDYLEQEAVTGVATNDFTVASSANFQPGQTIEHSNDNAFYKVIDVPDATSVLVDKTITGAAAGNISVCQDSIETKDFTFDGRCNIDGLGGTRTNQAFNLEYCVHSNFEAKVINCKDTNGGAYAGNNLVYKLEIFNIFHCEATSNGGACYQCNYCEIDNIYNCTASTSGGACYQCNNCKISNIYNCSATTGGACRLCNYCRIDNIYDCSASTAGGGCNSCNYCRISNIYNCSATSSGGACSLCDNCTILNIHNCSSGASGGGCSSCDNCRISNIYDCTILSTTGDAIGGGCTGCTNSQISNIYNCSVETTNAGSNAYGGGCNVCEKSQINNIQNCSATATTGDARGGGCFQCHDSQINNIYDCSCQVTTGNAYGGGCSNCDTTKVSNIYACTCDCSGAGAAEGGGVFANTNGTIMDIHDCVVTDAVGANGLGGAAASCQQICILGNYTGNLDDAGAANTDTFSAMTNYCNNFLFDGTADQTAAAGPTNWD